MTSLPQGWHGMTSFSKKVPSTSKPLQSSVSCEVPKLRQKWISDTSKSKLSVHSKPVIMSSQNVKGNISCSTHSSAPRTRYMQDASQLLTSKSKSAVNTEIANLRKEILSLKDENAILKSRIRKVAEDNNRKTRQLEKIRTPKIETTGLNDKKTESAESIALLRRKCLRLESTLKEKEVVLKKFINGMNGLTVDELKDLITGFDKKGQNNRLNEGILNGKPAANKFVHSECSKRIPPKPAWNAAKDNSANLEIVRLKDSIHRLQNENKRLLQQLKERDQEIKHLKLQLQRITASANKNDSRLSQLPHSIIDSSSHIHLNAVKRGLQLNIGKKNDSRETSYNQELQKRKTQPKQVSSKATKTMPNSHGTFVLTKITSHIPKSTGAVLLPSSYSDSTLDIKVQIMRKNVAARKIQRSWRHHRQKILEKNLILEKEKAVILLQSVLWGHAERLELLENISTLEGYPESEYYNTEAAAVRHLWTTKQYPS